MKTSSLSHLFAPELAPDRAAEGASDLTVRSELPVVAADGSSFTLVQIARPFPEPTDPVLLFLPAMGAEASYYEPFARALATAGAGSLALMDLRGQGRSSERASHFADFGYREMVEIDLPAAIAALRGRYPNRPLLLVGHSLGGQLATLAAARNHAELGPTARGVAGVAGLILIASGSAHVHAWPAASRLRARITAAAVRFVAALLPFYPGRLLGFGGNQPRRLMRDWGRVTRTGIYAPEGSTFDYESAMRKLEIPTLALGIEGDPIAPPASTDALLDKVERSRIDRLEAEGVARHRPWKRHFSWARSPESVVGPILLWLARR
jgi:predicted alpha/beta hydrolase